MSLAAQLPAGRRGQMLALGLLAVALLAAWLAAGAPLLDWYAARAARLDQQRVLAERMAALAATLPDLERQAHAAGHHAAAAPQPADTDALAAAALQQRLGHLATEAGTQFASIETLQPEPIDGGRRIRLRVSLSATWPVLMSLFRAIESASPPLLIDDLDLRADAAQNAAHDATGPVVQAQFSVITLVAGAASGDRS